jgi:hypothetical protein
VAQPAGAPATAIDRGAEALAGSRAGRALLSVLIVALIVATVAWNLPPGSGMPSAAASSALRADVMKLGGPLMYGLGLDQDWSVFAPPRMQVIGFEARVRYADGREAVWRPPVSTGALVGAYRDYRWGKYIENEIADANRGVLWKPFAAWIARRYSSASRRPALVILIRRFYDLFPVTGGGRPQHGPWREFTYYVYHVPSGGTP